MKNRRAANVLYAENRRRFCGLKRNAGGRHGLDVEVVITSDIPANH